MRLTVRGRNLPGSTFGQYRNVHVGLQVRRDPSGLVPGDGSEATWATDVAVTDDGDYRGEAVQGKKGARFLYLTWGTVEGQTFTMFRRAKLMLDDLPADLRSTQAVVLELPLTQEDGSPRCARVPAHLLAWHEDGGTSSLIPAAEGPTATADREDPADQA